MPKSIFKTRVVPLDLPETNETIYMKPLSVKDAMAIDRIEDDYDKVPWMIVYCVCDKNGERFYEDEDIGSILEDWTMDTLEAFSKQFEAAYGDQSPLPALPSGPSLQDFDHETS